MKIDRIMTILKNLYFLFAVFAGVYVTFCCLYQGASIDSLCFAFSCLAIPLFFPLLALFLLMHFYKKGWVRQKEFLYISNYEVTLFSFVLHSFAMGFSFAWLILFFLGIFVCGHISFIKLSAFIVFLSFSYLLFKKGKKTRNRLQKYFKTWVREEVKK